MPVAARLLVTLSMAPLPMLRVLAVAVFVVLEKPPIVLLTPAASASAPTAVALAGVPSTTAFVDAPRFPPAPTASAPLLIATVPAKELLPVKLSVPGPLKLNPPLPVIGALIVGLRPAATLIAAAPVRFSDMAGLAATV